MLKFLNEENFCEFADESVSDYDEFESMVKELGLDINCFFVDDGVYTINKAWYLEKFITIPMPVISKDVISMFRLDEVVKYRRERNRKLEEKRDFVRIFVLIEKCFRMPFFLDLYRELSDEEFIKLYEFVYSTCEYDFKELLTEDIITRLMKVRNVDDIKAKLREEYSITDDEITIYRGEADKSRSYKSGAVSWTMDCDVANFFANRFNAVNPKIYKATVNVNDILMVIDGEKEVLVARDCLKNVSMV